MISSINPAFVDKNMSYDTLMLYSMVSFFYIISPGPAIFLAIYNGATNGFQSVALTATGNITGLLLLSVLSVSGLSTILLASATLFFVVKVMGACYLVYLGIRQIIASRQFSSDSFSQQTKNQPCLLFYFKEGFLLAVTNPKAIIFFVALFPQFLDLNEPLVLQFSVMTLLFMLFSFLSLSSYGYLAQKAKAVLTNAKNMQWFQRISGGLFIGMGISLLQAKRAG